MPDAALTRTPDYYEVLGVPRDADGEAIKRSFRAHARALHPDVSADAAAADKFHQLSEAYAVLSKPSTRLLYDRFGYRGRGNGWFSPEGARAAADFLRRRATPVGEVLVSEFEAERGARRQLRWLRKEPCEACEGEGAAPGAMSMACPACEGSGRRRLESSLADGERLIQLDDCDTCGGRGRLVSDPCPACGGGGVTMFEESAEITVPAGVADGERLPVSEQSAREVVVVRVLAAPPEHRFIRYVAVLGLAVALIFLWLLLR
ncbi:MAG TPA: DnaJ domain-containing protein [Gaiellaceae bacterium]